MKKTGLISSTFPSALIFSLLLTFAHGALAQTEVFRARLSPMPTTPQTVDDITGEGEVILTLSGNTLTVEGSFSGMSSAAAGVHLHNGPPAQPGPVVHALEIDMAPSGAIGGVIELTDEQVEMLRNNALYLQVHSQSNPPGELRGWIFLRSHFENLEQNNQRLRGR